MHHTKKSAPGKGAQYGAFDRPHYTPKVSPESFKHVIRPFKFYVFVQAEMKPPKRERGWADGGLCPFHADTRAGSFKVNMETGAYCCFACGTRGGDIIDFTMRLHGLTFPEAMDKLVRDWL